MTGDGPVFYPEPPVERTGGGPNADHSKGVPVLALVAVLLTLLGLWHASRQASDAPEQIEKSARGADRERPLDPAPAG